MSITSEPAFLGNQIDIFGASLQARAPPAKSVITAPALDSRVSSRKKKLTEKGKQFRLELLERKRNSVYLRLKEQITRINKLRESTEIEKEVLETARDNLDDLKDEFHDTHLEHDELLVTEEEREASYRWFDLRDREYTECRIRLCERIQAIEKDLYKSFSDRSSVKSAKSKVSKASSSSQAALSKALVDATAKAAKLQAEMDFLEQERELRRLQLKKAIAIATAEEKAIKGIIEEENNASVKEEVRSVKENIKGENDTKIEKDFSVKDKSERSSIFNQYSPSFMPKASKTAHLTGYEAVDSQPTSYELSTALREIVHLQAKQTELSSLIINQQRINHLPVKEPPVFSGDAFEYPAFVTAFDSIIAANVPSDRDRLYFLEKYTRGKANDVVKGFLAMPSDSAYREARKLLDHRFGNPVHVAEAYKSSLRNWPQIEDGNSSKLQEFSDFLVRCEEAMKCMQSTADIDNTQTLLQVCAKLPSYSGVKWCRYAYVLQAKTKATVKFKNLVDFVREEAELANDPVFSPDALKRERRKTGNYARGRINRPGSMSSKPKPSQSFATSATRSDSTANSSNQYIGNQPCPLCNGNHALSKCNQFLKNTAEERSEIIRNKSLCFRCFRGGHLSAQCPSKSSCEECGKRHNTLLHGAKPRSKTNNQQFTPRKPAFSTVKGPNIEKQLESKSPAVESNSNASSATYNSVNDRPMITNSKIVPVVLFHKDNPEKEVKVYALLDDASDTTFISTKSQHHLGIKGVEMNLNLHTMLGHQEIPVQRIEGLVVQRLDKRAEVELPKTYTRDRIPSRPDQIPKPEVAAKWPHLQRIKDKIPEYEESLEVGLLIGCNCPKAIKPKEVILGKSDEPYAIRTLLGWCVVGPVGELDGEALIDSNSHRILAREVIPNTKDSLSFVLVNPSKEVITPSAINRMFEMDFAEHKRSSQRGLSQEDRRFLEIAEKGIHQCHDGHYELPLPLKNDDVKLPNNKEAALRRLNQLKGRFQSKLNKKYRQDYVTFMNKVIENGYAEKVPEEENQNKPEARRNVWYIPHHGVYHPKKPNKIRVVFDCAAEYKNESLNKHLLQGPDLTNNLTGVLCRFRQEPVAFTCDIEGMFHQVKVNAEHRDLLRFLW